MRAAALSLGLLFSATAWAAAPVSGARGPSFIPLDLSVEQDPLGQGQYLRLFGEEGRNQQFEVGVDAAPNCSPVPIVLAVPPVVSGESAFALGKEGALWQLGKGFPKTVDQVRPGALALLSGAALPAVLYADALRLPSGSEVKLPFPAEGGQAVDGGWWVRSGTSAALLKTDGALAWRWDSGKLHPLCAALAAGDPYVGTSEGWLVALHRLTAKPRWKYRCGGAILALQPLATGGLLLLSSDHTVRRVAADGDLVWQVRLSARPAPKILAAKGGWLVGELGGRSLLLLDEEKGKTLWSWTAPGGELLRPPAVVGDTVCAVVSTGELHPTLWLLPLPGGEKKGETP